MWVGRLCFSSWNYRHSKLSELVSLLLLSFKYSHKRDLLGEFFLCLVPARMVCGGVMVWRAHPPLPTVWVQNLPVPWGDASPPTGCVTTRTTVAMVRTRCVRPHALRISSAAPAHWGESQASCCRCCSDSSIVNFLRHCQEWCMKKILEYFSIFAIKS